MTQCSNAILFGEAQRLIMIFFHEIRFSPANAWRQWFAWFAFEEQRLYFHSISRFWAEITEEGGSRMIVLHIFLRDSPDTISVNSHDRAFVWHRVDQEGNPFQTVITPYWEDPY